MTSVFVFYSHAVVTEILSKEKHVICGCCVQVKRLETSSTESVLEDEQYEMNKLRIKMSASVPQNRLSLFISILLNMEEDEFTLKVIGSSCLIIFNVAYSLNRKLPTNLVEMFSIVFFMSQN